MTALTDSCCVVWNRQLLDCLLANDHFINAVMSQLIGRDVTIKAYQSQVSYRYRRPVIYCCMLSIILLPSLCLIWLSLFLLLWHCVLSSHFYFYFYFFTFLMY